MELESESQRENLHRESRRRSPLSGVERDLRKRIFIRVRDDLSSLSLSLSESENSREREFIRGETIGRRRCPSRRIQMRFGERTERRRSSPSPNPAATCRETPGERATRSSLSLFESADLRCEIRERVETAYHQHSVRSQRTPHWQSPERSRDMIIAIAIGVVESELVREIPERESRRRSSLSLLESATCDRDSETESRRRSSLSLFESATQIETRRESASRTRFTLGRGTPLLVNTRVIGYTIESI
jgi:hypothetical protein